MATRLVVLKVSGYNKMTLQEQQLSKVLMIAQSIVEQAGLELIEISARLRDGAPDIEVLTDRAAGGITLAECGQVNQKITQALETSGILDFQLVVASPGLDRPLKNQKDFRRVIGQAARVLLLEKVEGKGEYSGVVTEAGAEEILLETQKAKIRIPYHKIQKAVLII